MSIGLDQCQSLSENQIAQIRKEMMENVAAPHKIEAKSPQFDSVAHLERYLAEHAPATYSRAIADVMRNSTVGVVDHPVQVDRTNAIAHATARDGNIASGVFQWISVEATSKASHCNFKDGKIVNQFDSSHQKTFDGINLAQAAALLHKFTGHEHSVVQLYSAQEHAAANRAFGKPVLAEPIHEGKVRAIYPGGDHRVEWRMHHESPRVVPHSAPEVAKEVRALPPKEVAHQERAEHKPITEAQRTEASAKVLETKADALHEMIHQKAFGLIPHADALHAVQLLNSLNSHEREVMIRVYGAKYGNKGEAPDDAIRREMRDNFHGGEAAMVFAALDAKISKRTKQATF